MKKFTALLFFLSGSICNAQVMFQKTYGGDSTETLSQVIPTNDGGYLLVGATKSYGNGDYDMLLVKTNSDGDMVWSKTYGDSLHGERVTTVEQTTDGGFIITGNFENNFSDIPLIKTDGSGNILWSKIFSVSGANYQGGNSVHQTFDGGYLIAGSSVYWGGCLIRTNNSGDTIWTRSYTGGLWQQYGGRSFILENTDGSIIFAFQTTAMGFGAIDYAIIKTDASGNLIWSKAINNFGMKKAIHTNDGGYLFEGTCCGGLESWQSGVALIKTNAFADTLWTKRYSSNYVLFEDIQQTSDGGYIITGAGMNGGGDVLLLKTDNSGNLSWVKNFGGSNYDRGISLLQAADGGYVIGGFSPSFGAGAEDFYFVKTNSSGVSGCYESTQPLNPPNSLQIDTIPILTHHPQITVSTSAPVVSIPPIQTSTLCYTVGIDGINTGENSVTIFPNPATNELVVSGLEFGAKNELAIYNALGEKVFIQQQTTSSKQQTVDVSQLPAGIYFLRVTTANGVVRKKVIVEK